jgi:hypothetical protein
MAFNWLVDPLRYYHPPWFEIGYSDNQRFQHPGLIRTEDFETVLIGTSHTEQLTAEDMNRLLGGQVLNLSMSGSLIVEQHTLLESALESGKVSRVLWEINYPSFSAGETANRDFEFPIYLYRPGVETPFRYLASWGTLKESLSALGGRRVSRLDELHRWDREFEFNEERVLASWDYMQQRWNDDLRAVWKLYSVKLENVPVLFEKYVADMVRRHPEVRFDLLLLPTSMLDYSNDFQVSEQRFAKRLALREAVADLAETRPNVAVWDFQLDPALSYDLRRYKDLEHFDLTVAREVLAGMSGTSPAATASLIRQNSERLSRKVEAYTRNFCAQQPGRCQDYLLDAIDQH